jgi:biopolymer transport protein ExbD
LHDRKITVEQLTQSIRDIQKKGSKVMLKINGDKSIKYRTVIKVLTAAGDSGVVRYLLVAERIKPSGGD